jgi:hypothetical protein
LALAAGAGIGLGTAVNQIPGVSDALTVDVLSESLANVLLASSNQKNRDFVSTKIATVQQHIGPGGYSPPDPNDPNDRDLKKGIFNRKEKHLEQARDKLKELSPKQRAQFENLLKTTEAQLKRWWSPRTGPK